MTRFLTLSLAGCLTLAWSVGEAQTTAKPYAYNMKTTVVRPAGSVAAASLKDKTKPSSTALTPCDAAWKQDVFSFSLLYDAGARKYDKKTSSWTSTVTDVYFFFYNPAALGLKPVAVPPATDEPLVTTPAYPELCETGKVANVISYRACDPRIWILDRPALGREPLAMRPLADAIDIRVGDVDHVYLSKDENLGTGKINDTVLRSYMSFDDLKQGLWSLIGIIGPPISLDPAVTPPPLVFSDPSDPSISPPSTWAAWDVTTFMLGSPWENGLTCD